jgi:hypothetical protein
LWREINKKEESDGRGKQKDHMRKLEKQRKKKRERKKHSEIIKKLEK